MRLILRNAKTTTEGKTYTAQFWTPGLVSYCDSGAGVALLRKEAMDAMLPSFVGKPVTIEHVEGSPEEIENSGKAVGKVTKAYWNPDTGWYNCDFTVENDEAKTKVESGWSVSCAFDVSDQTGPAGEYNAIPYQEEITSGTFTHLALVENPRYEDSKIFKNHKMRLNAKGVKMNGNFVKIKPPNRNFGETVAQVISESGDQLMVKVLKGWLGDDAGEFTIKKSDIIRWTDQHGNSKDNAKTVLISIPYRLLERDDYKNPDQELQAKGMRSVGGGGGVADFEFNGTESQAAAIVKQVLGTVSGVDIGMLNSKGEKAVVKENEKVITQGKIAKIVEKDGRFYIYSLAGKLLVYNDDLGMAKSNFEAIESGDTSFNAKQNDTAGDFGTVIREIKEQLYQMAQALGSKFSGKDNGRAGVFKKGESVRDNEGKWCTIVGEAESGDYYVVKYADGSTARMREGDLNNSKCVNGLGENDSIKWEVDESGERYFTDPVLKRKVYEKNLRNPEKVAMERLKQTHPDLYEKRLKENGKKEQVYKELTELGKLGKLGKDYHKYFRRLERTDVETEFQGMSVSDIADQIVMLENSKENASIGGEPYSVSIDHRPDERGGDVYRVALIKDGKEADHILVKGDAAAQDQKRKWLQQYNQKQNDAFGENIIRVKFRTKRGSTEEKYTTVEEFSSEANARLRASALNWDILSVEPIKKNSRVILKPGKSNSTQEKKPMFGLFKRKSKKNDQEAAPAKLPLEQIDVEIDGVAVPLSELVTGYKAEQAEVAEKQKLEQAQAAKEVTEAPAPEANADNTAPEDLNLENQEFSIEDGSRFNMTELVDSYNRRKAAKCNAEKEKEKDDYLNALDFGDGKSEAEARAKLKEMGWSDAEIEETIKTKKEGQAAADAAKKNASETPEEKAAKENAKKDPKYFHKLNDLKNAGEVITGKAIETLSDKIERGNARYGSKKK